jgi:hypothetical protein
MTINECVTAIRIWDQRRVYRKIYDCLQKNELRLNGPNGCFVVVSDEHSFLRTAMEMSILDSIANADDILSKMGINEAKELVDDDGI